MKKQKRINKKEGMAYQDYLDRLSMLPCPESLSQEEIAKYNKEHPLPSEEDIQRILKQARS